MHSQSSDTQKVVCVESQARLSANNSVSKLTNTQAMTKRKQNSNLVHQMKSSSTTDVNTLHKMTSTPTKSMNGNPSTSNHMNNTHNKSQQMHTNSRQLQQSRAFVPHVSPNHGRTDLSDEQVLSYQGYHQCPSYTSSSGTVSLSMSSPLIGNQHSNYHSQYSSYPNQVQIQSFHHDAGNRHNYSNRHNGSKKMYNSKSKRNGNSNNINTFSSSSNEKQTYNLNNNNNYSKNNNMSNNNNEYERNAANKSGCHLGQPITRNGHRSYNADTTKNISPSRDHYSSSSSSSSSSSVPLNKKRDSRTTSTTHSFDRDVCCITRPWPHNQYAENVQNSMLSFEWVRADGYTVGGQMSQYAYTDPSTGEFVTIASTVDGKSNHRMNKANRGNNNQKNGSAVTKRYTPPDRFMNRAPHVEIKDTPQNLTNGSKWDRLSIQVWDKFLMCQQKEGTYMKKMKMWKNMHCAVQESFSDYALYMVGSTISGFGSDVSDVDMCLVDSGKTGQVYFGNDLRLHSAKILKDFEELLRRNAIYGEFNLIPAKVPILRFKDTFHEFEIDLNYNNYVGVQNTQLMYCYGRTDWRLRPLALVVKIWAQYHGINNAKEMTISSYSLVLMVIHFLQCAVSPPVLPCLHDLYPNKFQKHQEIKSIDMHEELPPWFSQNKQTLGELFFQFFHYYTNFDFSTKAISVRKGCAVSIESCKMNNSPKNDPNQWKELCIEEPFDSTNTSHSCYDPLKFQWIRRVFTMSYEALYTTRDLKSIFENPFMPITP